MRIHACTRALDVSGTRGRLSWSHPAWRASLARPDLPVFPRRTQRSRGVCPPRGRPGPGCQSGPAADVPQTCLVDRRMAGGGGRIVQRTNQWQSAARGSKHRTIRHTGTHARTQVGMRGTTPVHGRARGVLPASSLIFAPPLPITRPSMSLGTMNRTCNVARNSKAMSTPSPAAPQGPCQHQAQLRQRAPLSWQSLPHARPRVDTRAVQ